MGHKSLKELKKAQPVGVGTQQKGTLKAQPKVRLCLSANVHRKTHKFVLSGTGCPYNKILTIL